jgi:LysM repeat protein
MKRAVAVFALLAALAAPSQAQSLSEKLEEARLVARVQIALADDDVLRAFTFRVAADDGVATVVGTVETTEQRERVVSVVGAQDGVERVVNEVRVAAGGAATAPELPPVAAEPERASEVEESEPEPEPEPTYHTVRRGDTLGAIAGRYGVTVSQIRQLNGISGSRIRAGQRLRVK